MKNNKIKFNSIYMPQKSSSIFIKISLVVLFLVCFGCVMVYSASYYSAMNTYNNQYHFLIKQIVGVVLGLVAMFVFSRIDYHKFTKWSKYILIASFACLILVFIPGIGVENYGAIYSQEHKGELSPTWKGGVQQHRVERSTYEYRDWRKAIFDRDLYICQCCGDKNGNGHNVELNAHHIRNWKDNENLRYEVNNGVTLCEKCHLDFHSRYGKTNNTYEQLVEFLNNNTDKKVC